MIPQLRGLDIEMGEPKYARTEFERRWLVDSAIRPVLDGFHSTLIEDRYIDGTRMRLRRMSRPDLGEVKWKLTKKYDTDAPATRPIVTIYLTEREYELLGTLPARELVKRRYHFPFGERWWSVDLFEGPLAGLEMVECEAEDLSSLDALLAPPWALREITDAIDWQCGALAAAQAIPEDR